MEESDPQKYAYGIVPLCRVERAAIEHALAATGGKRELTADLLGIGRTTLYRKMAGYKRLDRIIEKMNQPR